MSFKKFIKIRRKKQIKFISQLRNHDRFSLNSTSYLAGYEDYNLDGQGDIKKNSILNSIVDFQSQSNPTESIPISKSSVPSSNLELENTPTIVYNHEGVKQRLSNKFDSVKKSNK